MPFSRLTRTSPTDFKLSVMGGVQGRTQDYLDQRSNTEGGLVQENWFSLNNSYGITVNLFGKNQGYHVRVPWNIES